MKNLRPSEDLKAEASEGIADADKGEDSIGKHAGHSNKDYADQAERDLILTIKQLAQENKIEEKAVEELIDKAKRFLREKKVGKNISFALYYSKINQLYSTSRVGSPIKIRVHVKQWDIPKTFTTDKGDTLITCLLLEDTEKATMHTTDITNEALVRDIIDASRKFTYLDIVGTLVTIPLDAAGMKKEFRILVHTFRPSDSIKQLAEVEEKDEKEIEDLLKQLKVKKTTLLEYIKKELETEMWFVLENPLLETSVEAMILQAYSESWYEHVPARIHTLAIGAPGSGKKLLERAAWALNANISEANPVKVTSAGLNGVARQIKGGGGWISEPGLIPEAHKSTFVLQDFHSVRANQRIAALDTFSMVMEDGKCIDSTAAKKEHPAETAIHLDTNKITDLFPEKQKLVKEFIADVNIPLNVLSRFDYIVDIPPDIEKQIEISLERFRGNTIIGQKPEERLQKWAKKMRKLTAYLRDKHSEITIPEDVRAYAREKFEELQRENIEHLKDLQLLANFMQRMHNSIHKFIAAYARINDRSVAEREDVDNSMKFLIMKLNVLKEIQRQIKIPKSWEIPRGKAIAEWIVNTYKSGEEVTVKILQDKYESEFGIPLDDRTCQRWIQKVARPGMGKGKWVII